MNILKLCDEHINEVENLEKEIFSEPYSLKILQEMNDRKNYEILVYFDEKVRGYAVISSILDEIEIIRIAVSKEFRRKNIASLIFNKIIADFCVCDNTKIFLEVRKSNEKAINFYKKKGFLEIGSRKNYYNNPKEDAILMTLEV